jgi:hypothetical protein
MGSSRSTGVQYSVKSMFDRQTGFPGAKFNNVKVSSMLLATTYLAPLGSSGGSLKRAAYNLSLNQIQQNILLAYRR